jgi:hypothetical protein
VSYLQTTTNFPQEQPCDIMHWLLAVLQIVNAGGRLAPQKAIEKLFRELVDNFGADRVWEGIKQFSMIFGISDPVGVEGLFQSYPNLSSFLKSEEGQIALDQWFEKNSPTLRQAHQAFHELAKFVPTSTASRFTEGEVTLEGRGILRKVAQILGKESNNEESGNLRTGL